MTAARRGPLVAVLAGGRGARLGGAKPGTPLAGRPLIAWTLDVAAQVAGEVVVIAKGDSPLPPLDVPVWPEAEAAFHPRHGLVCALRGAGERTVLVLPVDMPLVPVMLLEVLLEKVADGAPAAVPRAGGRLHPLCAAFAPGVLRDLEDASADEPLSRTLERMAAFVVDADAVGEGLLNVNTPADLARAEALLSRR